MTSTPSRPEPIASPLRRIGQVSITATALARAVAFYRDTLGMQLLFQAPPALAFFDCGGVRLMLSEPEPGASTTGTSLIYYVVDDIAAVYALLVDREVVFKEPPHVVARMSDHDLWMAVCQDSEGNYVGLMSEVRR